VRDKIKFSRGPLKDTENLFDAAPGGKDHGKFMRDVDELVY